MASVDIIKALVTADDLAMKQILGRVVSKTVKMNMYNEDINANWIGDRIVRRESFPFMKGSVRLQYSSFKLELGDLFKINVSLYGITNMICRVMGKSSGEVQNDFIEITFEEDPDYSTLSTTLPLPIRGPVELDWSIVPFEDITLIESPYVLSEEAIQLIPLVGRQKGTELGFDLYMSLDGEASYSFLQTVESYVVHGVLVYDIDKTDTLDKGETGITIDFDVDGDVSVLQTITRTELIAGGNISLIANGTGYGELLGFEIITPDPVVDARYKLTNLYRGRYDTKNAEWTAGDDFYFIGIYYELLSDPQFAKGMTRHFKLVPYNSKGEGDISGATGVPHTFTGRAFSPYFVSNLEINGFGVNPAYLGWTGINLSWDTRVRGEGAGLNDPDSVVDTTPTWEGMFEVKVYVSDILVRTTTAINDDEWEYTKANNKSDNGTPPDSVRFDVVNYKETDGIRYDSLTVSNTVVRVGMSSTTTTTTV